MTKSTNNTESTALSNSRRGRPRGQTNDHRSYGPLGDLIRKRRTELKLGLLEVASACQCSVQFISNIEHGRAPLPWDKAQAIAKVLDLSMEALQAANLSVRSEFKAFVEKTTPIGLTRSPKERGQTIEGLRSSASLLTALQQNPEADELLRHYLNLDATRRSLLLAHAEELLQHQQEVSNA